MNMDFKKPTCWWSCRALPPPPTWSPPRGPHSPPGSDRCSPWMRPTDPRRRPSASRKQTTSKHRSRPPNINYTCSSGVHTSLQYCISKKIVTIFTQKHKIFFQIFSTHLHHSWCKWWITCRSTHTFDLNVRNSRENCANCNIEMCLADAITDILSK